MGGPPVELVYPVGETTAHRSHGSPVYLVVPNVPLPPSDITGAPSVPFRAYGIVVIVLISVVIIII